MSLLKLSVVQDYDQMSEMAASHVALQLKEKKDLVLGLATGSTPEGMYANLVKRHREGLLDFSAVTTFNLDEYTGLSRQHPQSYHAYMNEHFFNHVNIRSENINIPSLTDSNFSALDVCRDYEQKIVRAGGIDLQILGIGVNGHIGFNEPAPSLPLETHLVDLAPETIEANSRFFHSIDHVPRRAITMGIGSIMHAKMVLLIASGESKSQALKDSFSGFVTTEVPASLLQLHSNLTVILDREAASKL